MEEVTWKLFKNDYKNESLKDKVLNGTRFFLSPSLQAVYDYSNINNNLGQWTGYFLKDIQIFLDEEKNTLEGVYFENTNAFDYSIKDNSTSKIVYMREDNSMIKYDEIIFNSWASDKILIAKNILLLHDKQYDNTFIDFIQFEENNSLQERFESVWYLN